MPINRGFVQRIDVARAGLISVTLVHGDGSTGIYHISDLDADPERFNERLSKLAVLRDAMDRAEPVEIEHDKGKAGEEIQRAARISRDSITPPLQVTQVVGLVVEVAVHSENSLSGVAEYTDRAQVAVLSTMSQPVTLNLDLQAPERIAVAQQLELIREAKAQGSLARFIVSTQKERPGSWIVEVAVGDSLSQLGGEGTLGVSGFIESLSLIPVKFGAGGLQGTLAAVGFTTAPDFADAGNAVSLDPFAPQRIDLLVSRGSLTYQLFEAGLRDNLRMRVAYVPVNTGPGVPDHPGTAAGGAAARGTAARGTAAEGAAAGVAAAGGAAAGGVPPANLVLGAELLAPLASASRPVWVRIDRELLDRGPDAIDCVTGVPSSDLSVQTLRDLKIPYKAEWCGLGCFNDGVYRFQLELPGTYRILVDGKELCLYDATQAGVRFAYDCLDGDHRVCIEIDSWTCDNEFKLDVYRLR